MQLELVLTAATLCVAIVGVISGLFGMNLTNTHEGSYTAFILVRAPPTVPDTCVRVFQAAQTINFATCSDPHRPLHFCTFWVQRISVLAVAHEVLVHPPLSSSWKLSTSLTACAGQVSTLSSAFAILLFISIVAFCRWKKLF